MRYAKLTEGAPVFSPKRMIIGDNWVYNPTAEQLMELGYLPVVVSDPPETDDKHYAICTWAEEDGHIVQSWIVEELPDLAGPEDYEQALQQMGVDFSD